MRTNFALMQHHNYSLAELENMITLESEIYLHLLMQFIEEEKQQAEKERRKNG